MGQQGDSGAIIFGKYHPENKIPGNEESDQGPK